MDTEGAMPHPGTGDIHYGCKCGIELKVVVSRDYRKMTPPQLKSRVNLITIQVQSLIFTDAAELNIIAKLQSLSALKLIKKPL